MSDVVRGVSSKLWGITEAAREDCVLLAHHLSSDVGPAAYTSDERKALETAQVIGLRRGLRVVVDDRFAEVDRPTTWDDDYRAQAARYLGDRAEPGWEPRDRVVARFSAGVAAAIEASAAADIVIVNHGLALSLYVASVTTIDVVPFWQALTFPDAWRLDLEAGTIERLYFAGLPPPDV